MNHYAQWYLFVKFMFIYNIYIHTFIYFVHASVHESAPAIVRLGRSEYNLQESVLLVYHVGSMYPTQVHRPLKTLLAKPSHQP